MEENEVYIGTLTSFTCSPLLKLVSLYRQWQQLPHLHTIHHMILHLSDFDILKPFSQYTLSVGYYVHYGFIRLQSNFYMHSTWHVPFHASSLYFLPPLLYFIIFYTFQYQVCNFLHALPPLHVTLVNFYKYHHYS